MAYTNNLLFNNVFLKNLRPAAEELAAARYLVHSSARDWFRHADLSVPAAMADTWIQRLLNQQSLDLVPAELGDENAWFIVAPWEREKPLALCYVAPHGVDLDGYNPEGNLPKGQHWMIRAVSLARRAGCENLHWVVLTNGERWRLLDACALRCYEAFLEVDLFHLLSGEDDPMAAYLFHRLLRFEGSLEHDEAGKNKLDAFVAQSVKATEATERYLKSSVSDNLDTPGNADGIMAHLCMGLVHAIDPGRTRSFAPQERDAIYRDATYLLYRLLFILYAEARGLLPVERADYQAVSLRSIIEAASELRLDPHKLAEHPARLWTQLTTLFNAIQYSDEYLGVPPYNGGLFDNKDKPHLRDYAIENRFLAQALYELAFLPDPKGERPAEPIDYRDLSVRHLGSLYEGMIEYKLFIAEEELLARRDKDGRVKYESAAKTERKPNDEVIKPGKVYFAQSPHERKATGTHYTAEELVERLVRQTVVRLLEERWAAFEPRLEKWLAEIEATPDEAGRARLRGYVDSQLEAFVRQQILSLRICDLAMGSGHFLVHIAYIVTNFILEVLSATPWDNPAINLDPSYWRRLVVENCLYGVDINGMAVELAKLSLWLATMQLGRPLSFLDHHLKRGNSLLGARLAEITEALAQSELNKETRGTVLAEKKGQYRFRETPKVVRHLEQANAALDKLALRSVREIGDIARQEEDYEAARVALAPYKKIGDLIVARRLGLKITDSEVSGIAHLLEAEAQNQFTDRQRLLWEQAQRALGTQETIHWELEFPKLFRSSDGGGSMSGPGFDVVIGNPPFLGGYKIRGDIGGSFAGYLRKAYSHATGQADLCSYMFRRAFEIVGHAGYMGMVATNTISQGDTRETGLAVIIADGGIIIYADRFVQWPGDATVEVNLVALAKTEDDTPQVMRICQLDSRPVPFISSWLDDYPEVRPHQLAENRGKAFIGDAVRGMGFILDTQEAQRLRSDLKNRDVIVPYLSGEDLNSDPFQTPSRYAICFQDWPLEKAMDYREPMRILLERVKPVRDQVKEKHEKDNWWLFARYRGELRKSTANLSSVLVRAVVSDTHEVTFVPNTVIFNHKVVVFAFDDGYHFSILQSWVHELWMRRYTSTMRTDTNYSISDCFDNFPFPRDPNDRTAGTATQIGQDCFQLRRQIMRERRIGLTSVSGLLNSPECTDLDISHLREVRQQLDSAVLACYGWQDITLQHDFYSGERGKTRFMPSPEARREIFTRLLALNEKIAAQEAAAGIAAAQPSDEAEEAGADDE